MKRMEDLGTIGTDALSGTPWRRHNAAPRRDTTPDIVARPRRTAARTAVFFTLLFAWLPACGGGGQIDFEGRNPVLGSPFPTTLLIPDSSGGNQALALTASHPLIGVFRFYLDDLVPPPMRFDFYSLQSVLLGIPDGLVLEDEPARAFVTTSGKAEGVWVFRPDEGFRFVDAFAYTGRLLPLPRPARDSRGDRVDSVIPTFTSGTALVGDKLYITTSNYTRAGVDPVCAPGTVWIVGYGGTEPGFHAAKPQGVILTGGFNPTEATAFVFLDETQDPPVTRRALLVTNTGVLTIRGGTGVPLSEGSVDVVDPERDCIVARYPLGYGAPGFSKIAVATQGIAGGGTVYRGYLGSAGYNHVYELDLTGLHHYLGACPDPEDVPLLHPRVLAGPDNPIRATTDPAGSPNEVVQVVVNHDGTRAYATGFNTGTLAVLELSIEAFRMENPDGSVEFVPYPSPTAPLEVIQVTDPMPSLNETGPGPLAMRPGVPGTDFQGPDVFVLTGTPIGEMRAVKTY